jgi:hypothetical protein
MLLAGGDERRGRAAQRELPPAAVSACDDDAATVVADLDDRHGLLLAAEMPYARGRPDPRRRTRRPHRDRSSPRSRRAGAHAGDIVGQDAGPGRDARDESARSFANVVLSSQGQALLQAAGFGKP